MSSTKRPVITVGSEAQQELFPSISSQSETRVSSQYRGELTFHLPEPNYIVIGDQLLETHLREAGEDFCFVTRSVLGKLDWSDFESAYKPGGRRPYHPQLMLGIILYGIARRVTSLRGLERLARLDLGCMWVSGDACPDLSALCRFLNKHAKLLTDDFFTALTREVLSITKSDCSSVAGDGTVIQAAASRFGTIKREAAEQAQRSAQGALRKQPDDPKKKEKQSELTWWHQPLRNARRLAGTKSENPRIRR